MIFRSRIENQLIKLVHFAPGKFVHVAEGHRWKGNGIHGLLTGLEADNNRHLLIAIPHAVN